MSEKSISNSTNNFGGGLLKLQAIPFVLTNGMSLFPAFVIAQISVYHEGMDKYVLPLILYYCFKTTILLVIRRKVFDCRILLKFSFIMGIIGCLFGFLMDYSYIFAVLSGISLGMTSGTAFPSFRTISFNEDTYNQFKMGKMDQIVQAVYGLIFSIILFYLVANNARWAFLFIGLNIILAAAIIRKFPGYEIKQSVDLPHYSILGTIGLFAIAFTSIFVAKNSIELGRDSYFFGFLILLATVLTLYLIVQHRGHKKQPVPSFFLVLSIYKGMILNFLFVFCTFYKVFLTQNKALYIVYTLYLSGLLLGGTITSLLSKTFKKYNYFQILSAGIIIGLCAVISKYTFYPGIFILSVFITQLNRRLNRDIYQYDQLPEEVRLVTKYRLTNIGSILQQVVMVGFVSFAVSFSSKVSIKDIFYPDYGNPTEGNILLYLIIAKFMLVIFFIVFLLILLRKHNQQDHDSLFYMDKKL